jgi:hypothetical protein
MFKTTVAGLADNGYRVMVCEFAYPCTPSIPGPFSHFDKQLSGYPFSPDGQAKFIEDTLLWLYSQQNVVGALYFAPQFYETYLTNVWGAFAWFDDSGEARPAAFSIGEVVSLQSGLVVQRDARAAIITAWDAIDKAQSGLRTDGLQTAQSKVQQAWSSYRAGVFAAATQLANEAADAASVATNPTIRMIFTVFATGVGVVALLAIAILVIKVVPMLQKRQPRAPSVA